MLTNEQRNAMAAEVLPKAKRYARKMARGNKQLAEHLEDVATDTVIKALNHYDESKGEFFEFVMSYLDREVIDDKGNKKRVGPLRRNTPRFLKKRAIEPAATPMGDDSDDPECINPPAKHQFELSLDAKELPPRLFEAFKLHYVDGHSLDETARMLGVHFHTLRDLHVEAAMYLSGRTDAKGEAMLAELERLGSEMPMRLAA